MKSNDNQSDRPLRHSGHRIASDKEGYPVYPAEEDIYSKYHEEKDVNPEDISESKKFDLNKDSFPGNENTSSTSIINGLNVNMPGSDLDIPGSELDDEMENVGSEDEENNYYSLGGDEHND